MSFIIISRLYEFAFRTVLLALDESSPFLSLSLVTWPLSTEDRPEFFRSSVHHTECCFHHSRYLAVYIHIEDTQWVSMTLKRTRTLSCGNSPRFPDQVYHMIWSSGCFHANFSFRRGHRWVVNKKQIHTILGRWVLLHKLPGAASYHP